MWDYVFWNVLHFFLKISPSQVKVVIIKEKSQKSWEFDMENISED